MRQFLQDTAAVPLSAHGAAGEKAEGRELDVGRICTSICELAAEVFDTPQSAVKLYEDGRLTIKGGSGFAAEATLDDLSFCGRKLVPGEPLVIPDAAADAHYFLEAAVLGGPRLRFYADMPLVYQGVVLGVLILAGRQPRHDFSAHKIALFRQFADNAATTLALARSLAMRTEAEVELKSSRSRFERAQEMTAIGHWVIDLTSRDVTWSKGLYAIYGLSPKAYKPRIETQLDIYEPQDRQLIIGWFQRAVNTGEDFDFSVGIVRRKDKLTRTIRTCGGVEYDGAGRPLRLCGIVRDVTDTGAGDEIVHRSRAVEDANEAKDAFLAHVAGELKAPLDNILNYARALNDLRHGNPDVAGYTASLLKSARALQALIKETVDVSALEMAPGRETDAHSAEDAVNVIDLVKEVINQFATQARGNQNKLTAHFIDFDNPYARLDAMRLQQLLQNLLGNACKFTRNGLINVTASQVTIDSDPWLRISVRDTGIGMTDDQALRLFSDGRPGGLSISKAIVDLLGGHIGVVSRQGEGSNFWFEIPAQWARPMVKVTEAARAVAPRPPLDTRPPSGRAAPVDEDRINREYLKALLQEMKLDL